MWQKIVIASLIAMLLLGRVPSLLAMEIGKARPVAAQNQPVSHCHHSQAMTLQKRHTATGYSLSATCHGSGHCTCQPLATVSSNISPAKFVITLLQAQPAVPSLPTVAPQPPERPPRFS